MEKLNFIIVFIEGVLSFLSPCIIPILPVYLSLLSNSNADSIKEEKSYFFNTSLFRNTLFFTLGISTTFFILGSSIGFIGNIFREYKDLIMLIGGLVIIIMGLFYMDIIKISILNREKRFKTNTNDMNIVSAFMLGFTFSFGWTPCIGPMLSSVLIMATGAKTSTVSWILIFVYTLGFILPFILTSLFYNKLYKKIDILKRYLHVIKKIGGLVLIISGVFMMYSGYNEIQIKNKLEYDSIKQNDIDKESLRAIDFKLIDQYNKEHDLSKYKGKTVFLNFWATWCPPCINEMPHIEDLYKEYSKTRDDIVILGVASPNVGSEGSKNDIIDFIKDKNISFPTIFDENGELAYKYGISSYPSTFIIDKGGYVTKYVPGAMDKSMMKQLIEK